MINSRKLTTKLFTSLLTLALVGSLFSSEVNAQVGIPVCNPTLGIFANFRRLFDKSIEETTMNTGASVAVTLGYHFATGSSTRQTIGCTSYAIQRSPGLANSILGDAASCQIENAEAVCPSLFNQFGTGGQEVQGNGSLNSQLATSPIGGSLLGMAYSVENVLENEPVPVNMAYFFNDYARRVPIIGDSAFAQSVDYRQPFLNEIYTLWVVIRNMAYGLMSVVILVVGILMIMRKKISQQVVVNVQYALPKLALTLIFITFSYPIGAAIAGVSWALFNSAQSIVTSMADLSGLQTGADFLASEFGVGLVFTGFLLSFLRIGVGLAGGVGGVVVIIIAIIMYFAVMIRAFFIYLKMLVQTVSAPLQFVFGAIPGNDDQTVNWFKRMASYGVAIFLMQLTVQFVMLIVTQLLFSSTQAGGIVTDVLYGSLYVFFGVPLLFLFGLGFAFKIPSMVEAAIMGPQKRR